MTNPFISVIVGIILIILWIPVSFISEINNKGNKNETKSLKEALKSSDVNIEDSDLDTTNFKTTTIPIPSNSFSNDVADKYLDDVTGNYYIKITDIKKLDDNSEDIREYTKLKYFSNMTNDNYTYLVLKHGKSSVNFETETTTDGYTRSVNVYTLDDDDAISKIKKLTGLLPDGEEECENKFDMCIYQYYIGDTLDDIKNTIIEDKGESNLVQKWLGRILVFLCLFIGLILLISPIESFRNTISNFFPLLTGLLDLVISLYDTLSFVFSLILTVVLTSIVYFLVNHPIIGVAGTVLLASSIIYGVNGSLRNKNV